MKSFLVTLTPLEPYFFGGEKNFDFGKRKREIKQSNYIRSQTTPAQTTLLGALRYAVLAANNALITDFEDDTQRENAAALVGKESFSFNESCDFGVIGGISPLFIADGDDYLIPMPMNHKNGFEKYTPLIVAAVHEPHLSTGEGLTAVDYDPKKGCGEGWLDLSSGASVADNTLFAGEVRVGINSHRTDGVRDDKESFFKKEYIRLERGAFAFFAELETEPAEKLAKGIIVYLGQNKSTFLLRAEARENDMEQRIRAALSGKSELPFWYAFGDCRMTVKPTGFHIAATRLFRHLTTSADNRYYYRLNKSEKLYRLAQAGAVFYGDEPAFAKDSGCRKIGMNCLIYIGGR